MSDEERLATVRACKWVDEVVFDTPYDPSLELLIKLNCDFCVHGDDMSTTADGKDAYAEVKEAGRMKVVKRTEGVSTTDLVGRLLLMTRTHHIGTSPAITPMMASSSSRVSSPNLGALSGDLKKPAAGTAPPNFALEPPAVSQSPTITASTSPGVPPSHGTPNTVRRSSDVARPQPSMSTLSVRSPEKPANDKPISNFLPTTWRITQFSNHKTPLPTDKIVYIDGAFDLFHVGHIETLKQAKALGTFLYVGIHDDSTVNLHKGRNYPIMNLHERVMNVLSCRYVDEVVIGAPWVVTKDLITSLNLNIVCSGTNTKMDEEMEKVVGASNGGKPMADAYAEPKKQGMFREIETTHTLSTEDVVRRLIKNREEYEARNAKRAPKESAYLSTQKQFIAEI
jgi:ethanolamine-phosphate cytidylyltransferase